ncbi:MAG: OsmC family protein [Promethearchaeota archaeon]
MRKSKKLLSDETVKAYQDRLSEMERLKFSKDGDEKFIERVCAISEQINNLHVRTNVNEFVIENDEPKNLGGFNNAPRPIDTFLASLANCLEITSLLYCSFSNLNVESIKVKVEADIDKRSTLSDKEAPLPGFYNIKITYYIKMDEKLKKIKQVFKKVKDNCPIKGTLSRSHKIDYKIEII